MKYTLEFSEFPTLRSLSTLGNSQAKTNFAVCLRLCENEKCALE